MPSGISVRLSAVRRTSRVRRTVNGDRVRTGGGGDVGRQQRMALTSCALMRASMGPLPKRCASRSATALPAAGRDLS